MEARYSDSTSRVQKETGRELGVAPSLPQDLMGVKNFSEHPIHKSIIKTNRKWFSLEETGKSSSLISIFALFITNLESVSQKKHRFDEINL